MERLGLLPLLRRLNGRLDGDVSLSRLAADAGRSPFALHRAFRDLVGETPKQYTLRLRLERAAARLVSGPESVLEVALACGFASHEVFTRAFRRRFGATPRAYRVRGLAPGGDPARHAALVRAVGPCIGLFHLTREPRSPVMPPEIQRRDLAPQHILFIRRQVSQADVAAALGEILPRVFAHCQQTGAAFAGPPFARYPSMSRGLLTVEAGMPVAAATPGEGDIEAGTLAGGPAAVAIHAGPYDTLGDTHAALERWTQEQGVAASGPPWESYVTDPGDHPDPADWRTEVIHPLAR